MATKAHQKPHIACLTSEAIDKALTLLVDDLEKASHKQINAKSPIDQLAQAADVFDLVLTAFHDHVKKRIVNIRRQRNSMLPISRLPLEILLIIFLEVVDCPDHPEDIVVPASVSSSWYHACLSEPRLWSHLSSDMDVKYTNLRLERSGNAPLYINCSEHAEGYTAEEEFLNVVIKHKSRWKTFYIDSPYSDRLAFDYLAHTQFPILEDLTLYPLDEMKDSLNSLNISAPSLTRLTYDSFPFPLRSGPNLHSNLRNIEFTPCTEHNTVEEECCLIFSSAPSLENITIIGNLSVLPSWRVGDIFDSHIHNLSTLTLSKLPWKTIMALLSSISTPPDQRPQFSVIAVPRPHNFRAEFPQVTGVYSLLSTIRASEWLSVNLTYNDDEMTDSDEAEMGDDDEPGDEGKETFLLIATMGIGEGSASKQLLHLALKCNGYNPTPTVSPLINSGCFSKVRRMDVKGLHVFARHRTWSYSDLPSLEVLRVRLADMEGGSMMEHAMQELIRDLSSPKDPESGSWHWPRLRHVAFGGCMIERDSLLRLIRARCGNSDSTEVTSDYPRRLELVEMERCEAVSGGLGYLAAKYNVEIRLDWSPQW